MKVDSSLIRVVKQLAKEAYSEWGQYPINCWNDQDWIDSLREPADLQEWLEIRKSVASHYKEIESTEW